MYNWVLWESNNAPYHYIMYQKHIFIPFAMPQQFSISFNLFLMFLPSFFIIYLFLLYSSIHQLWHINNLQLLPSLFYFFRCSFLNVSQHDCVELNVKQEALPLSLFDFLPMIERVLKFPSMRSDSIRFDCLDVCLFFLYTIQITSSDVNWIT